MPRLIEMYVRCEQPSGNSDRQRRLHSVATEEELLAFANKVREAGGANVLEALLPSKPGNPNTCLIANALNFSCSICPMDEHFDTYPHEGRWQMVLPENTDHDQIAKLHEVIGGDLIGSGTAYDRFAITLPREIGNAANAFDYSLAFNNLNSMFL